MKKIISLVLCTLMVFSVTASLASCGSDSSGGGSNNNLNTNNSSTNPTNNGSNTTDAGSNTTDAGSNTTAPEADEVVISTEKGAALPAKLAVQKIDTKAYSSILVYEGGYLYGKDGKVGISSFDGKSDTGAKYVVAKGEEQFFIVGDRNEKGNAKDLTTLNAFGLVDVTGRVIVPNQYASIDVLSDRYVKVCEVTAERSEKDGALVSLSKSNSADGAEHYFDGVWYIYDIKTGTKVTGAQGKTPVNPRVRGTIISFKGDDDKDVVINNKGEAIDENADLFSDGSYILNGKMYDCDGKELFKVKTGGFEPYTAVDDGKHYVAAKYTDDGSVYAVMDKTGKIVSAEFTKNIDVNGLLIESEDKVYNFKGEQVVEGEFDYANYVKTAGIELYMLEKDKDLTVLDGAFNVIYKGKLEDGMRINRSYGTISKTQGKDYYVYSYAKKEFIQSNATGFLLAYTGKLPSYTLLDAISGDALIEGCRDYTVKVLDGTVYVTAKTSAGYDFYTVG